MIDEKSVINLVEERIRETDIFLVEVTVKSGNAIRVHLDRPGGISIEQCAEISHFLNNKLDREVEDYSLEVSSPGVGVPFKVKQQYEKNTGHVIEVVLKDGTRREGKLESVTGEGITLKSNREEAILDFSKIRSAREIITFS